MNNLRYVVTFILLLVVLSLAFFQMSLRGYTEVGRINEYVLYYNEEDTCINHSVIVDEVTYDIECESQYMLKSGFAEYGITEALVEEQIVTIDELEEDLTITQK